MPYRMEQHKILEAMDVYGGSFVQGLAHLFRLADATNRKILEESFRHYFEQYDEMATRIARRGINKQ